MARFFISYSRSVKDEVKKVVELLRASDHDVWWDEDIPVMSDWWATILEEIEQCEVFIFVTSEKSVVSLYCLAELKYASERRRPILPLIMGNPDSYPPIEGMPVRRQWLVYKDESYILDKINEALKIINWEQYTDIEVPRPPEPLSNEKSLIKQFQAARRLATELEFKEAIEILDNISFLDYEEWGSECITWIEKIHGYSELIQLVEDEATYERAAIKWNHYVKKYGRIFDPAKISDKIHKITQMTEQSTSVQRSIEKEADHSADVPKIAEPSLVEIPSEQVVQTQTSTQPVSIHPASKLPNKGKNKLPNWDWKWIIASIVIPLVAAIITIVPQVVTPLANTLSPQPTTLVPQTTDTSTPTAEPTATETQSPTATPTLTDTSTPTPLLTNTLNSSQQLQTLDAQQTEAAAYQTLTAISQIQTLGPLDNRATDTITANSNWEPQEREFDGVRMVLVPAGCFMMGEDTDIHRVCIDEPFWLDKIEVTQVDFERLDGIKANPNVFDGDRHPIETITWYEAEAFCRERRAGRLPTEAEWEFAARGPDGQVYPWIGGFEPDYAVYRDNSNNQTAEVGPNIRLAGASWVGALDMSGNVAEWTSSLSSDYPYDKDDGREDLSANGNRELRGGSWLNSENTLRAANRSEIYSPAHSSRSEGFRCARDFAVP